LFLKHTGGQGYFIVAAKKKEKKKKEKKGENDISLSGSTEPFLDSKPRICPKGAIT